jgi:hypothetical protein
MAGLGQAIHVLTDHAEDVDDRHTGGHDELRKPARIASSIRPVLDPTEVGQVRTVTGKD